jgi:DNA-binding MarR family transcriptional regulator
MHSTIVTLVELGAIDVETPARGRRARLHLTERGHALLRTAGAVAHELDAALPLDGLDASRMKAALLEIARPRP